MEWRGPFLVGDNSPQETVIGTSLEIGYSYKFSESPGPLKITSSFSNSVRAYAVKNIRSSPREELGRQAVCNRALIRSEQ